MFAFLGHLVLDGVWLVAGLGLAVLVGIFCAQYVKDKLTGVPAPLRAALKATESAAMTELKKAEAALVNDIGKIFVKVNAPAAAPAPAAPAPAAAPAPNASPAAAPGQ